MLACNTRRLFRRRWHNSEFISDYQRIAAEARSAFDAT
jgi:hypothetical protein